LSGSRNINTGQHIKRASLHMQANTCERPFKNAPNSNSNDRSSQSNPIQSNPIHPIQSNQKKMIDGQLRAKSRKVICGMQDICDLATQCRLTPRNVTFPVLQSRSCPASHLHKLHIPKHPGDEVVPALHDKQLTPTQKADGFANGA
jgi:hypothetical protein